MSLCARSLTLCLFREPIVPYLCKACTRVVVHCAIFVRLCERMKTFERFVGIIAFSVGVCVCVHLSICLHADNEQEGAAVATAIITSVHSHSE